MADTVTLGGIAFQDWEIPSKLPFGGRQQTNIHKLVGGTRVVDAMGPDPDPIGWQGRFRGPDALSRALAVDEMRKAGAAVPLTWGGLYYTVLITRFQFVPEHVNEIPYTIDTEVTDDPMQGAGGFGTTLDGLISADLGNLSGIFSSIAGFAGDFGF